MTSDLPLLSSTHALILLGFHFHVLTHQFAFVDYLEFENVICFSSFGQYPCSQHTCLSPYSKGIHVKV